MSQIIKCKFCGRLYEFASMLVGDQSCCAACRSAAKAAAWGPDTDEQRRKRESHFGQRPKGDK